MKNHKTRSISIRAKIVLPVSLLIIVLCAVMGTNSYTHTKSGMVAMGVEQARMAAFIATKVIDADQLSKLTSEKDEAYQELFVIVALNSCIRCFQMEIRSIMVWIQIIRTAIPVTDSLLKYRIRNCRGFSAECLMCRIL